MRYTLKRQEPKLLLDIPDEIIELACAAHWNCGLYPGQHEWEQIVELEDHRVPQLRLAMKAAISAAVAGGLTTATPDAAGEDGNNSLYILRDGIYDEAPEM